jgi:outer membrane protein assembly factor BamB
VVGLIEKWEKKGNEEMRKRRYKTFLGVVAAVGCILLLAGNLFSRPTLGVRRLAAAFEGKAGASSRTLSVAGQNKAPAKTSEAVLAVPAAPGDAWPQFRGTPQLTGVSSAALPATLTLAWTYEAGEAIESSAAISGGVVYVGTQKSELLAVDLETGQLRWKYATKEPIGESSPAVADGVVYVGDLGGVVHAVDARSGQPLWTFPTQSEVKSSPVVTAGKVLIGSYDQFFYALGARSGKLVWKVETEGPVHATPAVVDDVAYITGCDHRFRGVRIADGTVVFDLDAAAYTGASPAMLRRTAFFGTFNNDVLAVDLAARKILWRHEHKQRQFPFYSSAALGDGKVVVGGRDKLVHALDQHSGKELWTFPTRARVESSPAIAGGRVYIGSNDGRFYVLDLKTGKKLWEFEAGAPISASPAIASGRVVLGAQDGRLFCFR